MNEPILEVRNLSKQFNLAHGMWDKPVWLKAVDGATFSIRAGETLGIVGESGSGKSTLGRILLNLLRPTSGSAVFKGRTLYPMRRSERVFLRSQMQMVFQDPYASLNPRLKIGEAIAEPMRVVGATRAESARRVRTLLETVGLPPEAEHAYPHEFSGGQRQRIGIARALGVGPSFLVCDEVVSALDVSIQAQILNLFSELKSRLNLTYMFISHDFSVIRHVSDHIAVMYLGEIVETAETETLFDSPAHPYTQALISSIPDLSPEGKGEKIILEGDIPSAANPPSGCRFRTRCWRAQPRCADVHPELTQYAEGHLTRCLFPR